MEQDDSNTRGGRFLNPKSFVNRDYPEKSEIQERQHKGIFKFLFQNPQTRADQCRSLGHHKLRTPIFPKVQGTFLFFNHFSINIHIFFPTHTPPSGALHPQISPRTSPLATRLWKARKISDVSVVSGEKK